MTRPVARLMAPGALLMTALAVALEGCTSIDSSATHVASLSFDSLPSPAVVAGDTLRDSLGVAAPLHALAYATGSDTPIANASIQYIALDSGVTIGAGGYVTAQARSGSVRLVATSGTLQTSPLKPILLIARRPDSVAVSGAARDTVNYLPGGGATVNVSPQLNVKVATTDTAGGILGTQGWRVSFQASFRGATIAPGDTTVAWLVGDAGQASYLDTTDASGLAGRKIRVNPLGIRVTAVDSVIVLATVRYHGAAVRGSPLRFVILLQPKAAGATR
jgi:hypothetical protein